MRLIAATNRDLAQSVKAGEFREDLFHRLNVVQFFPPPLRERDQDVLILADFFLRFFSTKMNKPVDGLTDNANRKLSQHHWPGNIRELRNVIERALILETEGQIQASSLPDFQVEGRLKKTPLESQPFTGNLDDSLANYEREFIETVLTRHNDNVTHAAEELGLSRHALRYRMQRLHIGDSVKPEKASSD